MEKGNWEERKSLNNLEIEARKINANKRQSQERMEQKVEEDYGTHR